MSLAWEEKGQVSGPQGSCRRVGRKWTPINLSSVTQFTSYWKFSLLVMRSVDKRNRIQRSHKKVPFVLLPLPLEANYGQSLPGT